MLGAIADDFTGATDLATMLRRSGHTVVVAIEDSEPTAAELDGVDAVVLALKTRTAPPAHAVQDSLAALERLRGWGADRFYDKYCSTFDSTDEGNIGPVLDALSSAVGADRVVVVPSLPANGRTVRGGRLFVGDDLLEDSSMRFHPLTPMIRSRVSDLLRPQTPHDVTEIGLDVVRAGPAALRSALDRQDGRYVVIDAVDDDDLTAIGTATQDDPLVSGGSGLALGIPGSGRAAAEWSAPAAGGRVVLCGSASATTLRQVAAATAAHPTRSIDLDAAVANPGAEVEALLDWVRANIDGVPVVCAAREASDVRPPLGAIRTADLVETVLSRLAQTLVERGDASAILVAGGETSGAVVRALGVGSLRIGPEIAPGVCWSSAQTATGRTIALALKSGNFGADDLFTSAWGGLS